MPVRSDLGAQRRLRLWNSRLWILSAVLGAMTLYTTVSIVHDRSQMRQAAHVVVAVPAHEVMSRAAQRLDVIGAQTFAPVSAGAAPRPLTGREAVDALVRGQSEALRCKCRETLPARTFFRFDPATGAIDTAAMAAADAGNATPPAAMMAMMAMIARTARAQARRPLASRASSVDLSIDSTQGDDAIITALQYDSAQAPVAVYEFVADARHIVRDCSVARR